MNDDMCAAHSAAAQLHMCSQSGVGQRKLMVLYIMLVLCLSALGMPNSQTMRVIVNTSLLALHFNYSK